jgi:hypothetical protein
MLGGIGGGIIGGMTWIVVAGVIIHDPAVWIGGLLVAAAVAWSAWRLYLRQPTRPLLVVGVTIFLIGLIDLAFLAWVLPRLPTESMSLWIGSNQAAYAPIRPLAMVASASGAFVTAWQLWRYRSGRSKGFPPA